MVGSSSCSLYSVIQNVSGVLQNAGEFGFMVAVICDLHVAGNVFPNSFEATVKKMHRLLLHVLAHIYQCHWQEIVLFKLPTHLNTVFYHFHLFNKQFNLVEDKEMEVLDDLFQRLHHHATTHKSGLEGTIPAGSSSVATSVPNAATTGSGTHTVSTAVQTDSVVNMLSSSREKKENSVVCDSYPVLTLVT